MGIPIIRDGFAMPVKQERISSEKLAYMICANSATGAGLLVHGLNAADAAGQSVTHIGLSGTGEQLEISGMTTQSKVFGIVPSWPSACTAQTGLIRPWADSVTAALESRWMRFGADNESQYVDRLIEKTASSNGIFGVKVHWNQTASMRKKLTAALRQEMTEADSAPLELLLRTKLQSPRYIWLRRKNKVAQAISFFCRFVLE